MSRLKFSEWDKACCLDPLIVMARYIGVRKNGKEDGKRGTERKLHLLAVKVYQTRVLIINMERSMTITLRWPGFCLACFTFLRLQQTTNDAH